MTGTCKKSATFCGQNISTATWEIMACRKNRLTSALVWVEEVAHQDLDIFLLFWLLACKYYEMSLPATVLSQEWNNGELFQP